MPNSLGHTPADARVRGVEGAELRADLHRACAHAPGGAAEDPQVVAVERFVGRVRGQEDQAYGGAPRARPEPVPGRELPALRPFSHAHGAAPRVEPEPVPGRELPARRPFSSAYSGDENVPPEARKTWDIPAAGVRSSDISKSHAGARSLWSEQAAAEATVLRHAHLHEVCVIAHHEWVNLASGFLGGHAVTLTQ